MSTLLDEFIQEGRDFLQGIGEKLMALEKAPDSEELMTELFRLVHTLKGNSGLFDFPDMTRVLHAGEDLMDAVRDRRVRYSAELADRLLDAMDFVAQRFDEIESSGRISPDLAGVSAELASSLRALIEQAAVPPQEQAPVAADPQAPAASPEPAMAPPAGIPPLPETALQAVRQADFNGMPLWWIDYRPEAECFFKGEDPFNQARHIPGVIWGRAVAREAWPSMLEFDCFRCQVDFHAIAAAERAELDEYFRYTPEQVRIVPFDPRWLEPGQAGGKPADAAPVVQPSPAPPASLPAIPARFQQLLDTQAQVFAQPDSDDWLPGRLQAAAAALEAGLRHVGLDSAARLEALSAALEAALEACKAEPLRAWLIALEKELTGSPSERMVVEQTVVEQTVVEQTVVEQTAVEPAAATVAPPPATTVPAPTSVASAPVVRPPAAAEGDGEPKFGRRAEDVQVGKILKVDQVKVDRLMNLIGEMVVAKNSLPYLASKAENQYGVRELARDIKAQYAVINRIAEEMQDAIMQVRMMPVSFVFQRFPRLVRDLSRKLGKEVELVLEGEETEADKNIVEALADPLIHIVRNSLDHGLETPDVREAAGKPRTGRLLIRAAQESDRVVIEIVDDGRGIDPAVIKRKAYERGLIDEAQLDRLSDQEAVNLVFASGFSTAETVSDLSGRGVGMDVVRNAVTKVGGVVELTSEPGRGTRLRLSLPLSMAVTNVMIIESDRQIFGVPMDLIVETVRLPRAHIRTIKRHKTAVLRGRIVPLVALNELLAIDAEPLPNADDELAVMVVRVGNEQVGLLVDQFREVVDVILKPLPGELAQLSCYAGSALLGDGSVLMVLNPRELF